MSSLRQRRQGIRSYVFELDNFTCVWCDKKFKEEKLTLEHFIPKFHGGGDNLSNLLTACSKCNVQRGHNLLYKKEKLYSLLLKLSGRCCPIKENELYTVAMALRFTIKYGGKQKGAKAVLEKLKKRHGQDVGNNKPPHDFVEPCIRGKFAYRFHYERKNEVPVSLFTRLWMYIKSITKKN